MYWLLIKCSLISVGDTCFYNGAQNLVGCTADLFARGKWCSDAPLEKSRLQWERTKSRLKKCFWIFQNPMLEIMRDRLQWERTKSRLQKRFWIFQNSMLEIPCWSRGEEFGQEEEKEQMCVYCFTYVGIYIDYILNCLTTSSTDYNNITTKKQQNRLF